ncbi:YnfA family protein [Kingella kingae]|uniref:YnfA family protein n=1 Tax=Kingella kingae TaxID=504 RepID=UPI000402BEC6|nr:YnfA family protein [Kingella kingae]
MIKTLSLFILTALAEIIGCWLPYLWLRQSKSAWLIMPAAASLAAFTYLLTLHPAASGRIYAAYSGVYISIALLWLRCCRWHGVAPRRLHWRSIVFCWCSRYRVGQCAGCLIKPAHFFARF